MFTKSHAWYDEIYGFKDYAGAAENLMAVIAARCPNAGTLLDVACGTGRHLEYFSRKFACDGLDINDQLLAKARARCPNVTFHSGNMIDFRLDRKFDAITLLFSSIAYVKYPENLVRTICTLERHLAPGGIILIEPFFTPENYWTGTITANHVDLPTLKLSWMYTSDPPKNNIASQNMKWMVGTPAGIEVFDELHEWGLFTQDDWQRAFDAAGLDFEFDATGPFNRGLYMLRRKER